MVETQELVKYLGKFLNVDAFKDYCHNGLQVQGNKQISSIVTGVSANLEFLEQAAEMKADAVLTHHGLFWQGDSLQLTGPKYKRVQSLIQSNMNLLAYHLPLDIHPALGNNASIATLLNITNITKHNAGEVDSLLWMGETATTGEQLSNEINKKLNRKPIHITNDSSKKIKKVAWCTGAGQAFIELASSLGADAYITGETSERTPHLAKELNIDFFVAGHHATEIHGIKNLGEHLAKQFELKHTFINVPNLI